MTDSSLRGILITDISDHFPVFTIKQDIMGNNTQGVTQARQITPDCIDNLLNELPKKD